MSLILEARPLLLAIAAIISLSFLFYIGKMSVALFRGEFFTFLKETAEVFGKLKISSLFILLLIILFPIVGVYNYRINPRPTGFFEWGDILIGFIAAFALLLVILVQCYNSNKKQ